MGLKISNRSWTKWLASFRERHGRSPRILHIGNIANNAYLNAKILNEAGFDCDVLCNDYYHIMGCPEWEELDFDPTSIDEFSPDWSKVTPPSHRRPEWFAQGPLHLAVGYLISKRRGHRLRKTIFSKCLGHFNRTMCLSFWERVVLYPYLNFKISRALDHIFNSPDIGKRIEFFLNNSLILFPEVLKALVVPLLSSLIIFCVFAIRFVAIPIKVLLGNQLAHVNTEAIGENLELKFKETFPDRPDQLAISDWWRYQGIVPKLRALFSHYDIIQGYATSGLYPLVADWHPYVAYEHGTIRDIPFEKNSEGRLAALTYALADAVYMTNADSISSLKKLKVKNAIFGIHGFDERSVLRRLERGLKNRSESRFGLAENIKVFFAPARHHWKTGHPTWRKGNDLIVRAVAFLAQGEFKNFKVVFIDWGKEVTLTKALIEELGIEDFFIWKKPVNKKDLFQHYANCDGVIDQFILPCLGGISIEAMSVGCAPVITRLDSAAMGEFYQSIPPLLNCATEVEIAHAMKVVITEPKRAAEIVANCSNWMKFYHSHEVILDTHSRMYAIALSPEDFQWKPSEMETINATL